MAESKTIDEDFMKKVEILQMQRDFYKSLLDTLPFTVFAKNKKGEYVYANKFCNKINGFENDDLIGKTDKDILNESIFRILNGLSNRKMKNLSVSKKFENNIENCFINGSSIQKFSQDPNSSVILYAYCSTNPLS